MRAVPAAGKLSEAEFLRQLLELARALGWRSAHFRPARTAKGWRTPLAGDAKGWPDLVLVRGRRALFVELKVGRGEPTWEQTLWLEALRGAGLDARLWRPEDWREIEDTLQGEGS